MKTTLRKTMSLILIAIFVLTAVPFSALADDAVAIQEYKAELIPVVNGNPGSTYGDNDIPYAVAEFSNLTEDTTYDVGIYAAQYRNGALVNVWRNIMTVNPGESKAIDCTFQNIGELKDSEIYLMILDPKTLTPYTDVKVMKYDGTPKDATLYLVGDSIAQSYYGYPYPIQGWGYYIGEYFNEDIKVDNRAKSGWTTDHYLYPDAIYTKEDGLYDYGIELRKKDKSDGSPGDLKKVGDADRSKAWPQILSELKAGDFVLLSLGINDATSGNVPLDRYGENLKTIFNQASEKGATVIFATPTIYGSAWDETLPESFVEDRAVYAEKMKEVALECGAMCLPLGASLADIYNTMADEYAAANPNSTELERQQYARGYFHIYGNIVTTPIADGGLGYAKYDRWGSTADDPQHYNTKASDDLSLLIVKLLKDANSPLADYIDYAAVDAHTEKTLHKDGLCKVYDDVKPVK